MIPFFKLLERNCDSAPTGKLPGARTKNRSVWSSGEITVGYKNKYTSYFCPNISTLLFNIIIMVCGHRSSSSSTGSSPLGIIIEFRQSLQRPPTSLSPSHTHTHTARDSSYSQLLVSYTCLSSQFLFQHRQQSIGHRNRIQGIVAVASHITLPITHTHIACDSSYGQLLVSCSCLSPQNNSASIFCWRLQSAMHGPSNQYECRGGQ